MILGITLSPMGYQSGRTIVAALFCWSFIFFSDAYASRFAEYVSKSISGYTVSKCLGWFGLVAILLLELVT